MELIIKRLLIILLILQLPKKVAAQNTASDSLQLLLKAAKHDTTRLRILNNSIDSEVDDNVWPIYNAQMSKLALENVNKTSEKDPLHKIYQAHYANSLNNFGLMYYNKGEIKKAIENYNKCLKILESVKDKKTMSSCLNNIGNCYRQEGNIAKAVECFNKSLKLKEEINDKQGVITSLINIAFVFQRQGNFLESLEYYTLALKFAEQLKDKRNIVQCLNSIGYVYQSENNYPKALEYYAKSMAIADEIHDKQGQATGFNNIGFVYQKQKDSQKALEYYKRSLAIQEEVQNKRGISSVLINIGRIFMDQDSLETARSFFERSLKLKEEGADQEGMANCFCNIGETYYKQGNIAKAIEYGQKALVIAKSIGFPIHINNAASLLYRSYKKQNNGLMALEMHELYVRMKDSLNSAERHEASMKKEFEFEYERKVTEDSLRNASVLMEEQFKHNQQITQQRLYTFGGVIGFVLMLVIAGISIVAFRSKHKTNLIITEQKQVLEKQKTEVESQKNIIEKQKHKVEEHRKEIIESINYAKRLQEAILPPEKLIKEHLPNTFVIYKPKDIVAGDFYWFEHLNGTNYIAAADCTGHGVPGALVSMICISALNRVVLEFGITDPGKILDKTRELVLETFSKSGEDVKDGMDISLAKIELIKESKKLEPGKIIIPKGKSFAEVTESALRYKVEWAGANNPLWYFKGTEHFEIKANKQPIGRTEKPTPFVTHTIELNKGDKLYLFTDGHADQFGGPKGKKFKYKQLLELLNSHHHQDLETQKNILTSAFQNWKGKLDQIDDVTIIGIKV